MSVSQVDPSRGIENSMFDIDFASISMKNEQNSMVLYASGPPCVVTVATAILMC